MTTIDGQRLPRIVEGKPEGPLQMDAELAAFALNCWIGDRLHSNLLAARQSPEAYAAHVRMLLVRYLVALEALDAERAEKETE